MSKQEKYLLGILTIILFLVTGTYFYNFFGFHFSKSINDWGSFGDYFGGVLNPLLTCILIYLVIKEGIDSRRNYLESKQISLKSQEQIDNQIRILKPKPEVVYYLKHENSRVYAILENIGNAVAYDINPEYKFKEEEPSSYLSERIFRLQAIHYIAPNQKAGVFIGHMNINDEVIGIPEHTVELEFFGKIDEQRILFQRTFNIDKTILSTLVKGNEIENAIEKVAQAVKSNKR